MLKLIENSSEAMDFARYLVERVDLGDYAVGVCGAFMMDTNKRSSKIDIVLARKRDAAGKVLDEDVAVGLLSVVQDITRTAGLVYYTRPRVLWYDLLEEEDKVLSRGLATDYPTPFRTMVRSLRWLDENSCPIADVASDDVDEDADEDETEDETEDVEVDKSAESAEGLKEGTPADDAPYGLFENLNESERGMIDSMGGAN